MSTFFWGFILLASFACTPKANQVMDLSGQWNFQIDSLDQGEAEEWYLKQLPETVKLPGSMVENGKGSPVNNNTQWTGGIRDAQWYTRSNFKPYLDSVKFQFPYWLIPKLKYTGAAWYQKEIEVPSNWNGQQIELYMERCHWETKVWVDDAHVGMNNRLGTAHRYDLTQYLSPGKHVLSICVDNRIKEVNVGKESHSISDHTQSNWNGIVGKITLSTKPKVYVDAVSVWPNVSTKTAKVIVQLANVSASEQVISVELKAVCDVQLAQTEKQEITIPIGAQDVKMELPMGEDVLLWDEFNPNVYHLDVTVHSKVGTHTKSTTFGMRDFKVNGTQFAINGRPTFLRGTLECAIFPKTGYPPTDTAQWLRIFRIIKAHGLNHMRFHSWCPPKAAFDAADAEGIYVQVECSSWANQGVKLGDGAPLNEWLYKEGNTILKEYGNHPSFVMMAYGNEPGGNYQKKYLGKFVNYYKAKDNRRVYTSAAGWPIIPENEYNSANDNVRIQMWGGELKSIINAQPPRTDYDWADGIKDMTIPMVSHEIGQWCVYPNFKEIDKYDGVLKATNFEIFRNSLQAHHMGQQADSFLLASGKLQALCYKADIEAALRTPGFGGFQLLDLHDFPGQGTALVGVLDPFWEEKGYISPEEYSRFCNSTVPLVRLSKRIFKSGDEMVANVEVAHFGPEVLKSCIPTWKIVDQNGQTIKNGELPKTDIVQGNAILLGQIIAKLEVEKAQKFTLDVEVSGFSNAWDIWVYPVQNTVQKFDDIKVVQKLDNATIRYVAQGGKVLLSPKQGSVKPEFGGDVGIGFSSIFWNTAWTNGQKPHTLGVLVNPKHPVFNSFPTEYHSNWQWWDAMSHSNAIVLDTFNPNIKPLVQVIDDWFTNRKLALLFEVKVGKGKLLISGIDFTSDSQNRLEAQQLLFSIKNYMNSENFNPSVEVAAAEITEIFN